jgi:hypothetical protein
MKVPTLDSPQVRDRPVSTPYSNQNFDTGLRDVAQGVRQLGAGVDSAVGAYQHAKAKADSIAITEAEAELQSRWTTRMVGGDNKPGFLSTKGVTAAEQSGGLYEQMQKDRREIAEKLSDNGQKKHFLSRSGSLFTDARRRAETHISNQREAAAEAALKARTASAMDEVANNYADEETVAQQLSMLKAPIRALQLSPEDGAAKEATLEKEVAKIRLNQFLAANDWK